MNHEKIRAAIAMSMSFLQVIFGLIPAFVLLVGSMMLPIVGDRWQVILFVAAVLGTAGLCWAVAGYDPRNTKRVLVLLLIGELTIMYPLALMFPSIASRPLDEWGVTALILMLGPFFVGAIHTFRSARQVFRNESN